MEEAFLDVRERGIRRPFDVGHFGKRSKALGPGLREGLGRAMVLWTVAPCNCPIDAARPRRGFLLYNFCGDRVVSFSSASFHLADEDTSRTPRLTGILKRRKNRRQGCRERMPQTRTPKSRKAEPRLSLLFPSRICSRTYLSDMTLTIIMTTTFDYSNNYHDYNPL